MNYTEFKQTVRKNALANPSLYEGRYTCKSCRKAYEQYKQEQELQQMRLIYKSIQAGEVSTDEIVWLQEHKQKVLATNDATLCQWAGITEEEYNQGKLED